MSVAESLFQSKDCRLFFNLLTFSGVAKGIQRMQERNYERGQIARNTMVQRSDAFWSRIRAAQRRDSEARRSMVEGIRRQFDKMRNLFTTVQERQDSQAQQNKAALSSWVNGAFLKISIIHCSLMPRIVGMVAKARSLSSWDRARKERNKEAIRKMLDPGRVFSNRADTIEQPRSENPAWDIFGRGVDFVLGRSGDVAEEAEELSVW